MTTYLVPDGCSSQPTPLDAAWEDLLMMSLGTAGKLEEERKKVQIPVMDDKLCEME